MPDPTLRREQWIARPLREVHAFFADPANLESLTPPWLRFRILTPLPVRMGEGTLLDYEIRLRGIRMRWQSEITLWDPPHAFTDEQRRGPYRRWVHRHRFEAAAGGTRVIDEVDFAVPGGPWVARCFVERDLRRIFDYRQQQLGRGFGQGQA